MAGSRHSLALDSQLARVEPLPGVAEQLGLRRSIALLGSSGRAQSLVMGLAEGAVKLGGFRRQRGVGDQDRRAALADLDAA